MCLDGGHIMHLDHLIPAAQYLRMSTEHQQYSMQNQAAAIQQYAELNGFQIVRTYADAARSGVVLKRRLGLQQLLKDVIAGTREFRAILVYDVSRWGRFQDMDEAAHYEFLCKSVQIPVHYCGEIFSNDGTIPNLIMKTLKRTMAGEYSRELGVKISAGLARLARLGFKQGGVPGYGLRRMLLSPDGTPKQQLDSGQRKSLVADRVILVPGPEHEVKVVREIYRMLIKDGFSVRRIGCELNRRGIEYMSGSHWSSRAVYEILTHLKYIGYHAFGRTSSRLFTPTIRLPRSQWIVISAAFEPLIDYPTFAQAQQILYQRSLNKPEQEMLDALRMLLARYGKLSGRLMDASPSTGGQYTYRHRFGSLKRAYELVGYRYCYQLGGVDLRRLTRALREELIAKLVELFPDELTAIKRGGKWRTQLRLQTGEFVSVLIARAAPYRAKTLRWIAQPVAYEQHYMTLVARLDQENRSFMDFYVLPTLDKPKRFVLHDQDAWLSRGKQLVGLTEFLKVVAEIRPQSSKHLCAPNLRV
jgi:DNA invertase Pin-like site-specific DNA recombinase